MRDVAIMDIAVNLARIGNWAADDFEGKEKRIHMFLDQTKGYVNNMDITAYPTRTQQTLNQFMKVFDALLSQTLRNPEEKLLWAEVMLTWSNILTHRANIAAQT